MPQCRRRQLLETRPGEGPHAPQGRRPRSRQENSLHLRAVYLPVTLPGLRVVEEAVETEDQMPLPNMTLTSRPENRHRYRAQFRQAACRPTTLGMCSLRLQALITGSTIHIYRANAK